MPGGKGGVDVLLEEAEFLVAVGTAHDGEGPVLQVGQERHLHLQHVLGEVPLGHAVVRVHDLVGIRDAHAADLGLAFLQAQGGRRLVQSGALRLPHDLRRALVLAQAAEGGVPQDAVPGALGEGHLGHQLRRHPVRSLGCRPLDGRGERVVLLGEGLHALGQVAELALVEPRPHPPHVGELLLGVVLSQHEGAEAGAAALGIGPAGDHELAGLQALHLQPVLRALPQA
jgi:hypothetical protein